MNKREFLQQTTTEGISQVIINSVLYFDANSNKQFDRLGGWTGKKFEANGFFRVKKMNDNELLHLREMHF